MLHPEDKELISDAHDSLADVKMTYIQAGDYFDGTENKKQPTGIERYFTRPYGRKERVGRLSLYERQERWPPA